MSLFLEQLKSLATTFGQPTKEVRLLLLISKYPSILSNTIGRVYPFNLSFKFTFPCTET